MAEVACGESLRAFPAPTRATASLYERLILAAKPVGYWRLGESIATTPAGDAAPIAHPGAYHGPVSCCQKGAIKSDANTSITFKADAYVEIADDTALSIPTSGVGMTVECWMRPDALDFPVSSEGYIHWLGKGDGHANEWGFRFYPKSDGERSNRISAYAWNLDGGLGAGAYFQDHLVAGDWIHIVAIFNDPSATPAVPMPGVSINRDGALRQSPPNKGCRYYNPPDWNVTPTHGKAPLRLGTRDLKTFLIGGLDEIAVYPRILTPVEIMAHYKVGIGARLAPDEQRVLQQLLKSHK